MVINGRVGGSSRSWRRKAGLLAASSLLALGAGATAQAAGLPPLPVRQTVDERGVDLMSGSTSLSVTPLTIGPVGAGGLALTFYGTPYQDSFSGALNLNGINGSIVSYKASLGGATWLLTCNGTSCTSDQKDGASMTIDNVNNIFYLTLADGTIVTYKYSLGSNLGTAADSGRVSKIAKPAGETLTYTYSDQSFYDAGGYEKFFRLESVTNNFGYMVKYTYGGSGTPNLAPTRITAINNSVEYCPLDATACSGMTVTWPFVTLTSSTITDPMARTTTFPTASANGSSAFVSSTGRTTQYHYDSNSKVSSVTDAGATWTYAFTDNGTTLAGDVTGPTLTNSYGSYHFHRVIHTHKMPLYVTDDTDSFSNSTTYIHETDSGRLTSISAPGGVKVTYTLDGRGNATQTTYTPKTGSGLSTSTTSANFGTSCATSPASCNEPVYTVDSRGNQTDYTYNTTTGQVTSVTSPAPATGGIQPQTRYTYVTAPANIKNSSGTIVNATPSISIATRVSACAKLAYSGTPSTPCADVSDEVRTDYGYGPASAPSNLRPLTIAKGNSGLAATTTLTWDSMSNLSTATDANNHMTQYRYDAGREVVGVVGPDPDGAGTLHNRAVKFGYGAAGDHPGLLEVTQQGTVNSYSDADWSTFGVLTESYNIYDGYDRLVARVLKTGGANQSYQQFDYNLGGQLTCSVVRNNPTALASPPAQACTQSALGPFGPDPTVQYEYDAENRLLKQIAGVNSYPAYVPNVQRTEVTNSYGVDGELLTQKDAKGNLTTYVYDGFNRLSLVEPPSLTTAGASITTVGTPTATGYEKYTYDEASNIKTDTRRDGTVLTYNYDNLNNLTAATGGYAFTYDNFGRKRTAALTSGPTTTFVYDALGRVTSETNSAPSTTLAYGYDLVGNRTSLTYPGGLLMKYKYDATNAMTEVDDSANNPQVQYVYDALGRRSITYRGDQVTTYTGYDAALNLSSLQHVFGDVTKNLNTTYNYTPAGQLFGRITSNTLYDWTSASTVNRTYTPDGQNRYATVGGTSFTYDALGDLKSDGTTSYAYDSYGRLKTLSGGASATLSYDGLGRLSKTVGTSTTQLLYDGDQIIGEYDGSGTLLRRFVPGASLDEPVLWYEGTGVAAPHWLIADRQGSIVAVTNSLGGSGASTFAINTYDEAGVGSATNKGRFQFDGQPFIPEAGLYHLRARDYSPTLGRFMQPDPSGYADSLNLYHYAGNDPVNASDPSGLGPCTQIPTLTNPCTGVANGGPLDGRGVSFVPSPTPTPFGNGTYGDNGQGGIDFHQNSFAASILGPIGASGPPASVYGPNLGAVLQQIVVTGQRVKPGGLLLYHGPNPLDPDHLNDVLPEYSFLLRLSETVNRARAGRTNGLARHYYNNFPNRTTGAVLPNDPEGYTSYDIVETGLGGRGNNRLYVGNSSGLLFYTTTHTKSFVQIMTFGGP